MQQKTTSEIKNTVIDRIKSSNEVVINTVITRKVNDEVERRSKILAGAMSMVESLERNIAMCKTPDNVQYDANDNPIESFSKKRVENRKEYEKELSELTVIIDKAINENTENAYTELEKTVPSIYM